jgi:hypothetical protein
VLCPLRRFVDLSYVNYKEKPLYGQAFAQKESPWLM